MAAAEPIEEGTSSPERSSAVVPQTSPGLSAAPRRRRERRTPLPELIGPYRIEGVLGVGGMGSVYEATDSDGRAVALKVIRASLTSDDALRRFEREASVRLAHPNVVQVLDAAMDDEGQPYIVLEKLSGESLAARLRRRGRLSVDEVFDLGVQACRGLAAAHEAGVVHRDLKPSNLFCCDDGTLKLLDFGVASLQTAETQLTQSGQVVGTLYYLSPEQAERSAPMDHRTDIWSLGAVLYEALAGRPPFKEDTALATVVATMLATVPSLSEFRPDAPAALEAVIGRALSKEPRGRWESAAAFAQALEQAKASPHLAIAATDSPSATPLSTAEMKRLQAMAARAERGRVVADTDVIGLAPTSPMPTSPMPIPKRRKRRFLWLALSGTAAFGLAALATGLIALAMNSPDASEADVAGPRASAPPLVEPNEVELPPPALPASAAPPTATRAAASVDVETVADARPSPRERPRSTVRRRTSSGPSQATARRRRPRTPAMEASNPPDPPPPRARPREAAPVQIRSSWDDPPAASAPMVRGWE